MGSAWIVTHENTADLSETSHPKLFQRVQYGVRVICVGDVSARIGERRSKKKYRDIVGSKKRLEEVCEIVLDGELFFYRKEEKEREMFGNIFESTILRILLEVVARFQRDFSALRTIALLTLTRRRFDPRDPNSCASLCAYIDSSGVTLFRERVLHDASSHAGVATDTSCSLYFIRYVYWFLCHHTLLCSATSAELSSRSLTRVTCDEKLSLL